MINSLEQYDVVIIGAGPAGTSTAIAYKKLKPDLKVAIVDKALFPRDKSCGDAIGPGVIHALKRYNIEDILEKQSPVISTSLSGTGDVEIKNYIPKVKNKEDSVVYVVPRKELDYKLLKKALDFGVVDFTGNRFEGMTRNASNWIVEISNDEGSRSLSTKLIVGADGANSRVRKSLGVKTNKDRDKAIAIRAYVDSPNFVEYFNERSVLFEINLSAEKGYAWAFPSNNNLVNIGIGVPLNLFKKDDMNLDSLLDIFIGKLRSKGITLNNIRAQKSYILPFASSNTQLAYDQVALVGDAGSMINPMSGEGIFYGMEAGYILAKSTFDKLDSGVLNGGLNLYEKEFKKRFRKHFLSCTLARRVLEIPFMTRRLLLIAKYDKATIDFIIELLFDEAYLTFKELILLGIKFVMPLKLLKLGLKKTSSS